MFAKLLGIIVAMGIVGCMLLVNRQQRIEAAHEMSLIHRRLSEQEQAVWRLRAEVARACSPDHIHFACQDAGGDWTPMLIEPSGPANGGRDTRQEAVRSDAPYVNNGVGG